MPLRKWALMILVTLMTHSFSLAVQTGPDQLSEQPMLMLPAMEPIPGTSSELVRTVESVIGSIDTQGLPPGAYTLWIAVFDDPDACEREVCQESDLNAARGGAHYAGGVVVGLDGSGTLSGRLSIDDVTGLGMGRYPLRSPSSAEIHLVLRSHGPVNDALLEEQLSGFSGGCSADTNATPATIGADGLFVCYNIQGAVHNASGR